MYRIRHRSFAVLHMIVCVSSFALDSLFVVCFVLLFSFSFLFHVFIFPVWIWFSLHISSVCIFQSDTFGSFHKGKKKKHRLVFWFHSTGHWNAASAFHYDLNAIEIQWATKWEKIWKRKIRICYSYFSVDFVLFAMSSMQEKEIV